MDDVHATPSGGGAHGGAHVLLDEVQRLGAEGLGHAQALGDGVDREHVRRAARLGRLHGAEAHGTEPQHGDDVAGTHAAVGDRVEAGAHHVAREQRHVVAEPVGNAAQHEVGVRHQRHVRLRALQRAERRAVAERARVLAAVIEAPQAEEAFPQAV